MLELVLGNYDIASGNGRRGYLRASITVSYENAVAVRKVICPYYAGSHGQLSESRNGARLALLNGSALAENVATWVAHRYNRWSSRPGTAPVIS